MAAQRTCTDPGLRTPCAEPTAIGIVYPESERRILAETFQGKSIGRPNDVAVRNNAKSIFRIPMLAQGFLGRAK